MSSPSPFAYLRKLSIGSLQSIERLFDEDVDFALLFPVRQIDITQTLQEERENRLQFALSFL